MGSERANNLRRGRRRRRKRQRELSIHDGDTRSSLFRLAYLGKEKVQKKPLLYSFFSLAFLFLLGRPAMEGCPFHFSFLSLPFLGLP